MVKAKTITMIKAFALSWILALTACGGSGGNGGAAPAPPVPSAEGLWIGSTSTTSTSRTVTGIVLDNDTYWILYSFPGVGSVIAGVVQGTGTSLNGSFSSSDGVDFNPVEKGINNATLSASYATKQSFNGSASYPNLNPTFTFTSSYNTDYDQTPSASAIAGTYVGPGSVNGGDELTTIIISSPGIVVGTGIEIGTGTVGCRFVGTVVPRAKGNLYDLSVDVSGVGACASGPGTVKGIGYFDAGAKRLYVAALNKSRSNGLIFVGIKS
jgi:hypothetical protein